MQKARFAPLPAQCRVDEDLRLRVQGLPPGGPVLLRARSAWHGGRVLASQARFVADHAGEVDLARDAPQAGSYEGVDAMGLFWSRVVEAAQGGDDALPTDPMRVLLTAQVEATGDGAQHLLQRSWSDAAVQSRELGDQGLVGRLFQRTGARADPAVLVVGGSGGGLQWSREMAALLASHGFAALALAYFAAPGLPSALDRIPLEYFGRALEWLQAQPGVDSRRAGVCGCSRGGELALLLGATFPALRAVVAYAGSGIAWPAYPPTGHSAWTWQGRDVPCAEVMPQAEWDAALARGEVTRDSFDWYFARLRDPAYVEAVGIPVERTRGPLLLVSGEADGMWPAAELSQFAVRRARARGHPHAVEHLRYPGAGHHIAWPNVATATAPFRHPVSGEEVAMGGDARSTAHASRASWPRVLDFLRASLA